MAKHLKVYAWTASSTDKHTHTNTLQHAHTHIANAPIPKNSQKWKIWQEISKCPHGPRLQLTNMLLAGPNACTATRVQNGAEHIFMNMCTRIYVCTYRYVGEYIYTHVYMTCCQLDQVRLRRRKSRMGCVYIYMGMYTRIHAKAEWCVYTSRRAYIFFSAYIFCTCICACLCVYTYIHTYTYDMLLAGPSACTATRVPNGVCIYL